MAKNCSTCDACECGKTKQIVTDVITSNGNKYLVHTTSNIIQFTLPEETTIEKETILVIDQNQQSLTVNGIKSTELSIQRPLAKNMNC